MLSFESVYRKRGGTFLADLLGDDPFDFWVGRFYVGVFGAISVGASIFGILIIVLSIAALGDGERGGHRLTPGARGELGCAARPFVSKPKPGLKPCRHPPKTAQA